MQSRIFRKFAMAATLAAAVGALTIVASASAADMTVKAPVPVAYSWTGFYVGVNAGGTWSNVSQSEDIGVVPYFGPAANGNIPSIQNSAAGQSLGSSGFTGGLQLGHNWQFDSVVVGIEADFNGNTGGAKTASSTVDYPTAIGMTYTIGQSVKNNWIATLRPRLGFATGNTLFYVTGGLAVGDVTFSRTFSDDFNLFAPQTASTSTTRVGWALGTGLEYAITRNWSVKGEYLYTDLGGASNAGLIGTTAFSGPMTGHATLVRQTARLGVNYHF
jgi:outer membrane immunogenic protein